MRILLINQFFWPDQAATSQMLGDLAQGLADRGHEVHAICSDAGYSKAATCAAPPVTIHRIKCLPFMRGRIGRILCYLSFYIGAAFLGLFVPRADLVITLTTPPLISLLGTLIKMLRGSRHFIWEMDVYPDVAIDLNYFAAGGVADRVTGVLADFSRRRADGIVALGECMKDRLVRRGIPAGKISVADNWANGQDIYPVRRLGGGEGRLVLLYSGNFGLAHDFETLAGAIRTLNEDDRFSFVFAGDGPLKRKLAVLCQQENIHSVEFRPFVGRAELCDSLAAGDIGVVTQAGACCGSVVPSKIYGLLAAGRPVLFIGPQEATPARIVEQFQCGWHVSCGDVASLVALLERLLNSPEEIQAAGERARQALLEHFDLHIGVDRICSILGVGGGVPYDAHLSPIGVEQVWARKVSG
jgi:colanic acid biosynthesis glycosyl transferase WcaI